MWRGLWGLGGGGEFWRLTRGISSLRDTLEMHAQVCVVGTDVVAPSAANDVRSP